MLAAFGALLGLYTYGIGLASLLALIPSFIHLYYRAVAPANAFRRPPLTGLAAWATAALCALAIFLSPALVCSLGFACLPPLNPIRVREPADPCSFFGMVTGGAFGLAVASGPAFLITRLLFPPDAYD
jgi:hypothetical protein